MRISLILLLCVLASPAFSEPLLPRPDLIVTQDGSGDFRSIQAAIESIPKTNSERMVVLIKNGTYREKVRVDASFVTLRGESRAGTRIEYPQLNDDFTQDPDKLGRAVINVNADDFVLENLTAENTAGQIGPHAFTIFGRGDRTVIVNCDVFSHGADTVSLWLGERGRYYHANCSFRGSVDFVCPRGWCYLTNCSFYEMKDSAAVWHDGSRNRDMKFVLRDCRFDGTNGWVLARHHADAQFYFLNCNFSATMADRPIHRVIYPLGNKPATEADLQRNRDLDEKNIWGERNYFWNCHRDGGDFSWFANNLATADVAPTLEQITAAWTFADKWNPESTTGPQIESLRMVSGQIIAIFNEAVTVKGRPRLKLVGSKFANYANGSGSNQLSFLPPEGVKSDVAAVDLNGGSIIACEASAQIRYANLSVPGASKIER